ncbi:MAG: sulfate adenylyltransferase subunit CysD [Candidatus Omnitrophica bacterium]|nr:sulfate adenylyltransferase subunit CysD [Candidatus Omnitrophota bacterium]
MNRVDIYLDKLESESIYIIREAYWLYRDNLALLWSCGKDSTALLHLLRKAFFGVIPFPVIHLDTTFKFKEIYDFRNRYSREWGLDLIVAKNQEALKKGISPDKGRDICCTALKTETLKQAIKKYRFKALLLAIRRDEHSIRAKERYFSPRDRDSKWDYFDQPLEMWDQFYRQKDRDETHLRVHPMLGWREIDIWRYIKREKLPVIDLYFARKNKRYRSIGCECCCQPVTSKANTIDKIIKELEDTDIAERSGRTQDKEKPFMMQKLRSLGYM